LNLANNKKEYILMKGNEQSPEESDKSFVNTHNNYLNSYYDGDLGIYNGLFLKNIKVTNRDGTISNVLSPLIMKNLDISVSLKNDSDFAINTSR
jgi:hypothetical protein